MAMIPRKVAAPGFARGEPETSEIGAAVRLPNTQQTEFCHRLRSGVTELQRDEALAVVGLNQHEDRLAAIARGLLQPLPDIGDARDRLAADLENPVARGDALFTCRPLGIDLGNNNAIAAACRRQRQAQGGHAGILALGLSAEATCRLSPECKCKRM